jgi:nucleotide-binding universal stress UspA family protein
MIKKILIGIDDSTYAEHAAKYGFGLAEKIDAHVGLVHITEPLAIPLNMTTGANEILGTPMQSLNVSDTDLLASQQQVAETILENIIKKYAGNQEVTQFNEYGSTGQGIIDCSEEFHADIIVLGIHNRSGFDRLLNGSVAEFVVRHSRIPVLVVPSKE